MNKLDVTSGIGLEEDMLANSVLLPKVALDTAGSTVPSVRDTGPNRMAKSGVESMKPTTPSSTI